MPESRMFEVAQELLIRARDHKVSWEETSWRGTYRVVFPDVVLTIPRTYPTLEDSGLSLKLMSETGRVVDSLDIEPDNDGYAALSQIFDFAEQYVRDTGVNKALHYLKST
tara:strand:- start:44 stop:373 length:330 start_codon:yes stop_codon:yes gene_type:complete